MAGKITRFTAHGLLPMELFAGQVFHETFKVYKIEGIECLNLLKIDQSELDELENGLENCGLNSWRMEFMVQIKPDRSTRVEVSGGPMHDHTKSIKLEYPILMFLWKGRVLSRVVGRSVKALRETISHNARRSALGSFERLSLDN
ncbi:hypothetical protein HUJ04_011475 [Dendroctonus ponderosae]|nr:hypothetical protein HUJ04_011475 [Dendroctonus ponderosae]